MSKKSNTSITNLQRDVIQIPATRIYSNRNIPLSPNNSFKKKDKDKDKNDFCMKKFSYIPKNPSLLNNTENNIIDSNSHNFDKKGEINSIFDVKKLSKKTNGILISNFKKNSKGNLFIPNKRLSPNRYQLNSDNKTNYYSNNSIFVNNKLKSPENKSKIIKFTEKSNRRNIKDKDIDKAGRIITIEDIGMSGEHRKILKKCLSKPNYTNDNIINNNFNINNLIYNDSNETFTSSKIKKHKSIKSNNKSNNLNSYQNNAIKGELIQNIKKSNLPSYAINNKNNSQILESQKNNESIQNLPKDYTINKRSTHNIIREFKYKNRSKSKSKSKNKDRNINERFSGNIKLKSQVNNNNININNVYINLENNKNKDYYSSECEFKPIIRDDINKNSYTEIYNKSNKNSKKELTLSNNQILTNIKKLWKKVGGVTEQYKIYFNENIIYSNNDDKQYFYTKEKENLINVINLLDKLNKNINYRNSINFQLKNFNKNQNYIKIEEISKLLIYLRASTINVINDFINFKKEIAYDLANNKYILNNINNFPYNYLYQIENDTSYLSSHAVLSSLFKFSKYSDPFLLTPSRDCKDNKYNVLPLKENVLQEIQKTNYFLMREKMNREEKKRISGRSPNNNYAFNRNSNMARKTNDNKVIKILTNRDNKFYNLSFCQNIYDFSINSNEIHKNKNENNKIIFCKNSSFELINKIKQFEEKYMKFCSNVYNLEIRNNIQNQVKGQNDYNKIFIPCSKASTFEIIFNKKINDNQKNLLEVLKNENNPQDKNSICSNIINFQIKNKYLELNKRKFDIKYLSCLKAQNFEINGIIKANNITNNNLKNNNSQMSQIQSNIPQNINPQNKNPNPNIIKGTTPIQNNVPRNTSNANFININQIVSPFNKAAYPPIELIYNAYLKTVSNDVKISFKINPNIYYYSTIGVSPKIILFKQNSSILFGMATLSYDPTKMNQRSLMITSISCSSNYSIIKTLLLLVAYCDKEIEYDELVLSLYFYQSETEKDKYILNEEYQNMIKTQTKFRWTALENTGNERKIKYNYRKEFALNKNVMMPNINNAIKNVKNYSQIRFYRFIKYNQTACGRGLYAKEYTFLFNVINLVLIYGKDPNNNDDELNILFSKISGLKKKRLLKMISEFNNVFYNRLNLFVEELGKNENKVYSEVLFKRFLPQFGKIEKDKFVGLSYCDISTNFSSIFKKRINGFEYNIISINNFNIEVFLLSNEKNNVDFNYLYFFKSENESISFILYELSPSSENEIENSGNDNYKNDLFNKILKKILTKDSEEPAKLYKKIGIPSFRYHPLFKKENIEQFKFSDCEILDGDDWFDFCIENNKNDSLFSFPELNNNKEDDVKIVNNGFAIGIINPDLTVDYHIPALNIYYISKNCWIKR